MSGETPGHAAYGCPECGSPEPRYPASTMTCQHQFHVMARAVWRVFPLPPCDAGPKHREAVSDALRAVGDYVAQQSVLAALRDLARHWEREYVTDDGWPLQCARELAAVLDRVDPA